MIAAKVEVEVTRKVFCWDVSNCLFVLVVCFGVWGMVWYGTMGVDFGEMLRFNVP